MPRTKIDCNREIVEGAQGFPATVALWNEYHDLIRMAKSNVTSTYGRGLLVDLHGHGHTIQRCELGYNLSGSALNLGSFSTSQKNALSIRELTQRTRVSLEEILRGPSSLGGLLQVRGFPAVPSPQYPAPGADEYFSGGYIVETHGTMESNPGQINAIQIECNFTGVRDTLDNRAAFAAQLVDSLDEFFSTHLGMRLASLAAPPALSRSADQILAEDNPLSLSLSVDDPAAVLAATAESSPFLDTASLQTGGSGTQRLLTVTPLTNAFGPNTRVTLTASNPAGGVAVEWFYLQVNPVNDPPVFSAPSNPTINPGFVLILPNPATDVEKDTLTYQMLSGLPTNATFQASNGTVTWRPTIAQAGQSYPMVIRVTDSGTNPLTATVTNTVKVLAAETPALSTLWSNRVTGSNTVPQLQISIQGQNGPDYIVSASTNLTDWTTLSTNTPGSFPFVWTDTNAGQFPRRFYQVRLGP
ncbi:MAG: hypothetical protein EBT68_03065 [Verrucomicrobia bacterium]|nr:hypothetical protein [Verrucomicrobiota bacterium]